MVKYALIFVAAMAFCLFVVWLAGYDFDRRGFDVSYLFVWGCIFSAFVAWGINIADGDR